VSNSSAFKDLPNVDQALFKVPSKTDLLAPRSIHAPRILLLYGSLRERSYGKLLTLEAERLLQAMGADTRVFDPCDLPLPDGHPEHHPKVQELRKLATWSEGWSGARPSAMER